MTFGPEHSPEEQWRRLRILLRIGLLLFAGLLLLLLYGLWVR